MINGTGKEFTYYEGLDSLDYEGEWKNDMRHGKGICYEDTNIYEGYWKEDKREGKGIFYSMHGHV